MKQMKSSDNAEPSEAQFAEGIYHQEEPVEDVQLISDPDVDIVVVDNESKMVTITVPRALGAAIQAAVKRNRYFITISYVRADRRIGTNCTTNGFPSDAFGGVLEQINAFTVKETKKSGGTVTSGQVAQDMRAQLKARRERSKQRRNKRKKGR